jgi:hypothetical protein
VIIKHRDNFFLIRSLLRAKSIMHLAFRPTADYPDDDRPTASALPVYATMLALERLTYIYIRSYTWIISSYCSFVGITV